MASYKMQKPPKYLFIVTDKDGKVLRNGNRDTPIWFRRPDAENAVRLNQHRFKGLKVHKFLFAELLND